MKTCAKCKHLKPATIEEFRKNKKSSDGFHSYCRPCERKWLCNTDARRAARCRYQTNLRLKAIGKLGGKCARCGITDPRVLQIDHVKGGGCQDRKQAGGPVKFYKQVIADETGKYQALCANDNIIKRLENKEHGGRRKYLLPTSKVEESTCAT